MSVSRWILSIVNLGSGSHEIMITKIIVIAIVCVYVYTCLHACWCVYSCAHDMVVSGQACEAVFLFPLCMGSEGSRNQDDFSIMARR